MEKAEQNGALKAVEFHFQFSRDGNQLDESDQNQGAVRYTSIKDCKRNW